MSTWIVLITFYSLRWEKLRLSFPFFLFFCQPLSTLCFCRMSVSMVFYGISLNTSNMNGNKYLNCFFSAFIDIIAYLAAWLFANRVTRPTLLFCAMMLSGVMLMVIQLIPEGVHSLYNSPSTKNDSAFLDANCFFFPPSDMHIMMQVFTLGGKIGIAAAFCFIYVFFTELFPTVVRNMGFGVVSTAAHVGSIICPFIIYTGKYSVIVYCLVDSKSSFFMHCHLACRVKTFM